MQDFEAPEVELGRSWDSRWDWLALPYLFERGGVDPEGIAIVYEEQSRTYGQLREQSRRLANALIGLGLDPGDRVALLSRNRLEYMEIEVGISSARGIMVALNWRLRPTEIADLLRRSGARAIFAENEFVAIVNELRRNGEVPELRTVIAVGHGGGDLGYDELCDSSSASLPERSGRLRDPHEIIFTPGDTGEPKGVVWSDGSVMWNAIQQVMDFQLGPDHSTYAILDLHHVAGRHALTWPILYQGATVHVRRSGNFGAEEVLRYMAEHSITHALWVPAMLYEILRLPTLERFDLGSLRMVICGGQPVSAAMARRAQAAFPGTDFIEVYGLADCGATVSFMPRRHARSKPGLAGKPAQHVELRIVDGHGADVPANVDGEILVRAPSVTAGYWGEPEMTSRIADGYVPTGDIGHFDEDGFLYVSGRIRDVILTGGMQVFPEEIEEVLRSHPAVSDAVVVGLPDEKWGETVCAVVKPHQGTAPEEGELIAYCSQRLAGFKKPSSVRFVDEIPRTAAGQAQKLILRERFGGRSVSALH